MTTEDPNDVNPRLDMVAEEWQEAIRAAHHSLNDYITPSITGTASSIRRPPMQVNNFNIKSTMIQMIQVTVQFSRHVQDDPNIHISNFFELYDAFKINRMSDDATRLRLFSFSLRDKVKS